MVPIAQVQDEPDRVDGRLVIERRVALGVHHPAAERRQEGDEEEGLGVVPGQRVAVGTSVPVAVPRDLGSLCEQFGERVRRVRHQFGVVHHHQVVADLVSHADGPALPLKQPVAVERAEVARREEVIQRPNCLGHAERADVVRRPIHEVRPAATHRREDVVIAELLGLLVERLDADGVLACVESRHQLVQQRPLRRVLLMPHADYDRAGGGGTLGGARAPVDSGQ